MRDLSSAWTWTYKFAFPTIWIGGFSLGTLALFIAPESVEGEHPENSQWLFLGATIVGTVFLYWFCMRLKRVRLSADSLHISNYRNEIVIPLRDVERVSGSRFTSPELMWLHFRRPTEFGSKVIFMPPTRFSFGFSQHPLVKELRTLISSRVAA